MAIKTMAYFALAAGLSLAGCSRQVVEAAPAGVGVAGAVPEVRAVHGIATVELDAVINPATKAPAFAYQGVAGVAPTIRVSPGDELRVTLHNELPAGTAAPNEVNLHFHGLEVSPDAPSDDAMRLAAPGATIAYDIHLSPHQQPGLYWYHPHAHGQTFWQITSGMSGVIVVEGLQRHYPALAAMRERIIVLRNPQDPPDYGGLPIAARPEPERSEVIAGRKRAGRFTLVDDDDAMGMPCADTPGMRVTVNDEQHPTIGIDPGERQLFRVLNASAGRYFDLTDGRPLQVVALDGVPLDAYPGSPPVETVDHLVVAPGARAEFVATGGAKPLELRSRCFVSGQAGDRDPEVMLATLRADGGAPRGARSALPLVTAAAGRGPALGSVAAEHTFTFTEDVDGFYINGKKYAMDAPPRLSHTAARSSAGGS